LLKTLFSVKMYFLKQSVTIELVRVCDKMFFYFVYRASEYLQPCHNRLKTRKKKQAALINVRKNNKEEEEKSYEKRI